MKKYEIDDGCSRIEFTCYKNDANISLMLECYDCGDNSLMSYLTIKPEIAVELIEFLQQSLKAKK